MAEDLKADLKNTTDAMLINEATMEEGKLEMQFGPDGRVIPQSVQDLFCTSGNGQKRHVARGKALIAELSKGSGRDPKYPQKASEVFQAFDVRPDDTGRTILLSISQLLNYILSNVSDNYP